MMWMENQTVNEKYLCRRFGMNIFIDKLKRLILDIVPLPCTI